MDRVASRINCRVEPGKERAEPLVEIAERYVMIFSKLLLLLPETNRAAHSGPILSVSKLSNEGSSLLLALERDVHYCYLVPLTIPVTILVCYANWVCLKFFRHE
ncbi:hypothetical protein PsorP6_009439 [Peronosclerospora sorghi]|uniref:Uncharacterized protein n=1 Tax=Peronosclerospora sorghi TaxID=230839 RepID=A0ACC0W096_9STRA|nr:hypothetical protein PsorP6_009439 [Peronosclerospora sorghi]